MKFKKLLLVVLLFVNFCSFGQILTFDFAGLAGNEATAVSNSNDAKKTMSDSKYKESLIGSKPSTKLEDGIAKTIEWAMSKDIASNLNNWVKSVQ